MTDPNRSQPADAEETPRPADMLEDTVAEAVERSYASRLTAGTNLSEEEKRLIAGKAASSRQGSPDETQ